MTYSKEVKNFAFERKLKETGSFGKQWYFPQKLPPL